MKILSLANALGIWNIYSLALTLNYKSLFIIVTLKASGMQLETSDSWYAFTKKAL